MSSQDRGPEIVGISILTLVLSCIFVFARTVTRTCIRPQFGLDDVFIIITLLIFVGYVAAEFSAVSYGFGKPITQLSPADAELALRSSVVGEFFATWTYPTGKAAIAYLLMRVFPGRALQWTLWIFVAINAVMFYLNGIFFFAQCSPTSFQWDKTIQGGHCWNPAFLEDWGYVTGSVGALTDFVFAMVPWCFIARLQMSKRKKIAIGIALSTGLFPFVCSILKIYYTSTLGANADPTYSTVNLVLTGEAELCAINIAACLPTLRPLYHWLKKRNTPDVSSAYRAPTQPQYDLDPKGFRGRSKKSNTGIRLDSLDDVSISAFARRSPSSQGDQTERTMHDAV